MLYTLVGNGKANETEIIATLLSLRDAVGAKDPTDEFWMAFQDIGTPGPTVAAILKFLTDSGITYEVVVPSERDATPEYSKADEFHLARRPLDYLIKLTQGRLQPGEESAILVLSDELDTDNVALYAIERAIAEGIPVYDLGGQMTPIVLEENPQPQVEVEGITVEPPTDDPAMNQFRQEADALPDTQMHEAAIEGASPMPNEGETAQEYFDRVDPQSPQRPILPLEVEQLTLFPPEEYEVEQEKSGLQDLLEENKMRPVDEGLSYTRLDLERLTRDELKALVKQQEVTPTDLRSKDSMIEALLAKLKPLAVDEHELIPDVEGKDLDPGYMHRTPGEQRAVNTQVIEESKEPEYEVRMSVENVTLPYSAWILRIGYDGVPVLTPIAPEKVALIDTILSEVPE